jgi:hypothetical protein
MTKVDRHFGVTHRLHLQGLRIRQARNQHDTCSKLNYLRHAGFLLGFFFHPDDGGNMFLRNVD